MSLRIVVLIICLMTVALSGAARGAPQQVQGSKRHYCRVACVTLTLLCRCIMQNHSSAGHDCKGYGSKCVENSASESDRETPHLPFLSGKFRCAGNRTGLVPQCACSIHTSQAKVQLAIVLTFCCLAVCQAGASRQVCWWHTTKGCQLQPGSPGSASMGER